MKLTVMKVLLLALALGLGASRSYAEGPAPQPAPHYHKGNAAPIHAFVVLLRLRYDLFARWKATGKWPDDSEANAALDGHSKYWNEKLESGHALLAGGMSGDYWDNVALIIFEAPSQSEAEAIVAADPAVKAYVFQAQVRPFDISFLSTKYGTLATNQTEARDSGSGH